MYQFLPIFDIMGNIPLLSQKNMTSTESMTFIVAMIIMMNPLGSLSIFLELTKNSNRTMHRKIAIQTGFAIIAILLLTLWSGRAILSLLGITIPAFRFAGGIILLLMGLSMLQSRESPVSHTQADNDAAKDRHSIAVVPMALPVIVGPGSISTLIIMAGDYPQFMNRLWMSLLCFFLATGTGIMLYYASAIAQRRSFSHQSGYSNYGYDYIGSCGWDVSRRFDRVTTSSSLIKF